MKNSILVVVFVIIALILSILVSYIKRKRYIALIESLEARDFEKFDSLHKSFITRALFPPFNLDYMKLNKLILDNKKDQVFDLISSFKKKRLNQKQKETVYMMGFNYAISTENKAYSKEYLDIIKTLNNDQMIKESSRIYDIYINKGNKYLDEMLDEIKDMPSHLRGVNEFLISLMYENMGDKQNSSKFKKQSEKHMKELDEKISKKKATK